MKVLFATCQEDDWIASCLWDGLQEVLGEENVWDAVGVPSLHPSPSGRGITASRKGRSLAGQLMRNIEESFDLLVLNACFLRQYDWHMPHNLRTLLKPDAKVAYVEGWDSAHEVHDPLVESKPPFHVDKVFRRELDPAFQYPYDCTHLSFAAPIRWFKPLAEQRPIDVFAVFNPHSEERYRCLEAVTSLRGSKVIAATDSVIQDHEQYLEMLRRSKLCVCPSGGAKSDTLRCYEAAACGAVPVMVDFPPRQRQPWFDTPGYTCCSASILASQFDVLLQQYALAESWKIYQYAKRVHTTRYRAETLLKAVFGVHGWELNERLIRRAGGTME